MRLVWSVAVVAFSVSVMASTVAIKNPRRWFNLCVVSWANSEMNGAGLDLHLDLGQTIQPGRRGTRDQLIRALRDAVRSGRLPAGTMLPPSRSLATDL